MVVMRPGTKGTGAVCGISPALRVFSLQHNPKLGWKSGARRVTVLAPSQTVFIHSWTTRNQVGVKEMSMTLVKKIALVGLALALAVPMIDRKSTRLNSSHLVISYAGFCLKKKKEK